jgi:hypothetical protein
LEKEARRARTRRGARGSRLAYRFNPFDIREINMTSSPIRQKASRLIAAMLLGATALVAAAPAEACMRFTNRTTYKLFVEVHWIGLNSPHQYGPIQTSVSQGEYIEPSCDDLWNLKTRYVISAEQPGGARRVVFDTAKDHPEGQNYRAGGNRHVTVFTGPDSEYSEKWFIEDRLF